MRSTLPSPSSSLDIFCPSIAPIITIFSLMFLKPHCTNQVTPRCIFFLYHDYRNLESEINMNAMKWKQQDFVRHLFNNPLVHISVSYKAAYNNNISHSWKALWRYKTRWKLIEMVQQQRNPSLDIHMKMTVLIHFSLFYWIHYWGMVVKTYDT